MSKLPTMEDFPFRQRASRRANDALGEVIGVEWLGEDVIYTDAIKAALAQPGRPRRWVRMWHRQLELEASTLAGSELARTRIAWRGNLRRIAACAGVSHQEQATIAMLVYGDAGVHHGPR